MDRNAEADEKRPTALPWSLVGPVLDFANQIIRIAEYGLSLFPDSPTTPPTTKEPASAQPLWSDLPEPPPSPVLHILPHGPASYYLWFHLPEAVAKTPLQLRETHTATGNITRQDSLSEGQEVLILPAPTAPGTYSLELGYAQTETWVPVSSRVEIHCSVPYPTTIQSPGPTVVNGGS